MLFIMADLIFFEEHNPFYASFIHGKTRKHACKPVLIISSGPLYNSRVA